MILTNIRPNGNTVMGQTSICINGNPMIKIYANVTGKPQACLFSNFQLENAPVNILNSYSYDNTVIESASGNINGQNGALRDSGSATTLDMIDNDNTSLNVHERRSINRYDSILTTTHFTTATRYYNPTMNVTDSRYGGIDTTSDGGRNIALDGMLRKNLNNTTAGFSEWPSPVLLNTEGGTTIQLSLTSDYSDVITKTATGKLTFVFNLIPSRQYFYKVLDANQNIVKTGSFVTEGQIRMLRFDQVSNVRDMGGYKTIDGTKQFIYGKVLRGAKLSHYDYYTGTSYTSADRNEFLNNLKVVKEVDLRQLKETLNTTNFLYTTYNNGTDIETVVSKALIFPNGSADSVSYIGITQTTSSGAKRSGFQQFMIFLKAILQSQGAVYIHCQEGRDRTGTFCMILEGVCGIAADGIFKDYELTTFHGNGTRRAELVDWDCADFLNNYTQSKWSDKRVLKALRTQCGSTATTVTGLIQDWFVNRYNTLTSSTQGYRIKDDNGNYITDGQTAMEYVQSKLLEDVHNVENSLVSNYLKTRSYSAADVTATSTAGISQADLFATDRMVGCNKYASYKNENFVCTDYITNSKPNPYVINISGANSVELSDGASTYIIANTNSTFTARVDQNGTATNVTFNDLPVIGPSTYNSGTDTPIKIWNLIPNKTYTYKVKDANGDVMKQGTIKTTGQLRMLHLEGVLNVRDLGGWPCYDDNNNLVGTIRYNKLFRGGQPDTSTYFNKIGVTNNDARMMTDFVKLGYQLDLRESDTDSSGDTGYKGTSSNKCSRFGKDTSTNKIPWERVRIVPYWAGLDYVTGADEGSNTTPLANMFIALGKIIKQLNLGKSVYFNCSQGADRAGTIAIIIEALVGVNDDSLLKDWELTSYSGAHIKYSSTVLYQEGCDYRAIHKDCSKYTSRFVEMKNNLFTYYPSSDGVNTLQKCLTNWFLQVSKLQAITTVTSNQWLHVGHGSDSGSKKTLSTSSNSYLALLNTNAGTSFTSPQEVIAFLKSHLIDYNK